MKTSKALIGYCGLYCGDCPAYKREIPDLARDLRKKLRESRVDRASPFLAKVHKGYKNYKQFDEVLGLLMNMRCKKVCRERVKAPACEMRKCCLEKGIGHCGFCGLLPCKELAEFVPDDRPGCEPGYHIRELRRRVEIGTEAWLKEQQDKWETA